MSRHEHGWPAFRVNRGSNTHGIAGVSTIHYATEDQGAPLLMVMDMGASGEMWGDEFTRPLVRSFRLRMPDNRGTERTARTETWRAQPAAIAAFDAANRLNRIAAATLVITGECDLIMPVQNSYAPARSIRGARGVVVKGTGHCFFWEAPERAAGAIAGLLEPLVTATAA